MIGPRPVSFERERFTLTPATLSKERLQQLMAASPAQSTRLAQALQISAIHAHMDSEIGLPGKGARKSGASSR